MTKFLQISTISSVSYHPPVVLYFPCFQDFSMLFDRPCAKDVSKVLQVSSTWAVCHQVTSALARGTYAIYRLPSAVCCLLSVCLLSAVCCLPSTICRSSSCHTHSAMKEADTRHYQDLMSVGVSVVSLINPTALLWSNCYTAMKPLSHHCHTSTPLPHYCHTNLIPRW
jgi:hypothetical protein